MYSVWNAKEKLSNESLDVLVVVVKTEYFSSLCWVGKICQVDQLFCFAPFVKLLMMKQNGDKSHQLVNL